MVENANSEASNEVRHGVSRSWGVITCVGLTLMVLVIGSVLGYNSARQLDDNRLLVTHTREVLESLEAVLSTLKDAETGQRGYLLAGDAKYLEPYENAFQHESGAFAQLRNLVSDNPDQLARLDVIRGKINLRLDELKHTVVLMQKGDREAALAIVRNDTGKAMTDEIRQDIAVMQRVEDDLLKARDVRAAASYRATVVVIVLTAVVGVVLLGLVGYLFQRNLEQKRRAAFVLGEEKERLRTTLASIGDAVISTDSRGNVSYLNPIAEQLTGWTHAETLGVPLSHVFRIVNESTGQPVENPAIRALKDGVIVGLANHTLLIARDGSKWPIDDSAAPIRIANGTLVGCVLVFRDITTRRKTEQALHASEERLRMAQHVSKIGTFEWNIQTGVNTWTQELEAMYGLAPGSFGGTQRTWEEMIHPDDRPHVIRSVGEALANGAFADEWRVVWGDGSTHWLAGRGMVFKDDDGKPLRLLGINIDITDRKQGEEKLRRLAAELSNADHRKDEFLATLAHELRNPLSPIRNGLQFLQRMEGDHSEHHQVRVMMQRQVDHLVRLVDDLMDVSRITRGTLELRRGRVELAQVLQSAVETAKPLIDSKGHELMMSLPATPLFVDADATRLAQVFANLLNNAAKYTDRGGRIWLTVRRQSSELLVSVKDTGVGIPSEMLPKIFEMFAQVDQTLEKSQGGLGIGLTLVRRLIEMHGGKIVAHSDGPGKGSEFIVHLAAELSLLRENPPTADENDAVLRTIRCRILVADDNEDSVASMAMLLSIMGNVVQTASDGLDAVRAAAEFEPDVIILDIGMPGLNGYEACRRIREQSIGGKAVMIALSGWGQEDDKRRSQEAGSDYHFVKPVDPATLERLLSQLKAMPT